jgi:hypothetical protein
MVVVIGGGRRGCDIGGEWLVVAMWVVLLVAVMGVRGGNGCDCSSGGGDSDLGGWWWC